MRINEIKSFIHKNKYIKNNFLTILFLISIISTFLCLFFVGNHSLISHDELLYANRANLIIDSRDWFTPFTKPHHKLIGSYWPTALSLKLFGQNEFAARLPSYIFSLVSLYIFYCLNNQFFNKQISRLSILILSSSILWFNYSHYCSPDILFILINLSAIYFLSKINSESNNEEIFRSLFFSAFLFSIGFFVRSYMELLPLISFSPFIINKLLTLKKQHLIYLLLGIIIGFLPSLINLFFAFLKYGDQGYLRPFSLLSQKVFEEEDLLQGFLFYPRNIFLFNLPSIIFLLNGIFSICKTKKKDPIFLFLVSPLIALVLLMITASTYTHYLLFIVPWLSTLISFGIIEVISFKNAINNISLNIFSLFSLLLGFSLSLISVYSIFSQNLIFDFNIISKLLIFIFGIFYVFLSYSLFCEVIKNNRRLNNILKILFLQILLFSYLFGSGIIGNPNNEIKKFIKSNNVNNDNIYVLENNIEGKRREILNFYLEKYRPYILSNLSPNEGKIYLYLLQSQLKEIIRNDVYQYEIVSNLKDLYFVKVNMKIN